MDPIKDSSSETENADNSMEWEDDKDIEKPDVSIDEGGSSTVDPNIISEDAASQPSTSRGTGRKRKSFYSGPQPEKISRNILDEKQEQEHPAVHEINKDETGDLASAISLTQTISEKTMSETLDVPSQGTSDIMPANLPNDDINRSEDVSADSSDNTGAISGQASTSRSFEQHDVETDTVFRHPGLQGVKPISKRRRSDSEGHSSDSKGRLSDSDAQPYNPKVRRSDSEGHSSDSKERMSESDGHSSDSKGRMSESDGHSSGPEGRMSDSEGQSSGPEGRLSDTEVHSSYPERRQPETVGPPSDPEGRQPETEGPSSDPEGRQPETEGHSSDPEGRRPEAEGDSSEPERRQSEAERLDFSSEFSTYFGDRFQKALKHLLDHGITDVETESGILSHFRRQRPENHLRCLICGLIIRRDPPNANTNILMSSSESDNE